MPLLGRRYRYLSLLGEGATAQARAHKPHNTLARACSGSLAHARTQDPVTSWHHGRPRAAACAGWAEVAITGSESRQAGFKTGLSAYGVAQGIELWKSGP